MRNPCKIPKIDNYCYLLLLMTVGVLYSLMSYFTPLQIDDYTFMGVYKDNNGGSLDFSLSAVWDYIMEIRQLDNSRMSNIMAPFSSLFAPWKYIFPWLTGFLCSLIIWEISKIAGLFRNKFISSAFIWLAIVLFLPWRGFIFVRDFSLNYIYPSALALGFVMSLIEGEERGWTGLRVSLVVLLGFLSASWHEGFSFTVLGGLLLWTALKKGKVSKVWWIILVFYAVIASVFAFSPGMINRGVKELKVGMPIVPVKLIADISLCVVMIGLYAIWLIAKNGRKRMKSLAGNPYFVIFTCAALLGVALSLILNHTARTAFWPELCAIVSLSIAIKYLIEEKHNASNKKYNWLILAACVVYVLCVAHGIHSIIWEHKYYVEDKCLISKIEKGEGQFFYDIIMPEEIPATTLYFPARSSWITSFHYICLENFYNRRIGVFPKSLENIDENMVENISGTLSLKRSGNALFTDISKIENEEHVLYINVTTKDGKELKGQPTFVRIFKTKKGDKFVYVKPHNLNAADIIEADIVY